MSEEKRAGIYELTWNTNSYPSGVYFYKPQACDYLDTKKMILKK